MDALRLIFPLSDGQLVLDGYVVETTESPHTGRSLRRMESDLTVPAAEARLINTAFQAPSLRDEQGSEWAGRVTTEKLPRPARAPQPPTRAARA